ncbi:MAG: acyl--CoA ligase [Verrucomicrobia bacterium]|nr:acyl--CoA ligase [Verrucomicrobiota bacterium]
MKPKDPLLERWAEILGKKADDPAIFNRDGEIVYSFRQIEDRARDFESEIGNFQSGALVAVQIGNHEDWPSILIACLRHQLVVLLIEQSITDQQRDAALKVCRASAIVEGAGSIRKIGNAPPNWNGQMPSLLKLTSGTTAEPRAIRFRSSQLLADCDQICDTMGISDVDLNFGVIAVSHSYGFSNLLTPLIGRGVPMVLSRDRTPRAVLDDIARTKATVFPGTPVFYQAFCEMENPPPLPELRLCISAGAPLPVSVARKFRDRFGLSIHSFYGASECGGICYDRDGTRDIDGYVGEPMKNVDLEIVVEPKAKSTQIRVRSAAVGDAYFPDSEEQRLGKGTFVPDDLLTRDGEGFKIVGRVSDVINVAGKKVSPAEIEQVLLQFRGVRQAIAFGRPAAAEALRNEEVVACVVGDAVSEDELLEFCRRELSSWQVPRKILILDAIPVDERGKISRRELARRI